MMTIGNERNQKNISQEKKLTLVSYLQEDTDEENDDEQITTSALVNSASSHQLILTHKLNTHLPESGLNPLVDAAGQLFTTMGKLKQLKSCDDLNGLHNELVQEIENYKEIVQTLGYVEDYLSEYIPITCYALCVTLDDIILNTSWGGDGKWDTYALVHTFTPDAPSHMSFFIILERLIRDTDVYIDVIEFMYICLSLGFKCGYNSNTTEFNHEQVQQIINALYKRIRAYRKDFSKTLSPFPIRASNSEPRNLNHIPLWLLILIFSSCSIVAFTGGMYLLSCFFKV